MWRTAVITFVGLAFLACNGGQGRVPTARPAATPTEVSKADLSGQCGEDAPEATLHYGDQTQQDPYLSYNWIGEDCAVTGHPILTVGLPASALTVPTGARPVLTFSEAPRSVDASVRPLPLEKTFPTASGIEIDVNDLHAIPKEPLEVRTIVEQELDLGLLSPGDYVVEVGSGWPQGSLSFAFRIEIVEAVDD